MEKIEREQEITVLTKPQHEIAGYFTYLDYLFLSESTVLGYLQLPSRETAEVKPKKKSAIALTEPLECL